MTQRNPPSKARCRTPAETRTFGPAPFNGYEGEWREIAAIVNDQAPAPDLAGLIDDLRFALALADQAARIVRRISQEVPA